MVELAIMAMDSLPPRQRGVWIDRLARLYATDLRSIVARVPLGRMSQVDRRFCVAIMKSTREGLRHGV